MLISVHTETLFSLAVVLVALRRAFLTAFSDSGGFGNKILSFSRTMVMANVNWSLCFIKYLTTNIEEKWRHSSTHPLRQRWPNSRFRSTSQSRPLFGLYRNLFAASVRSTAHRLTAFFGSICLCEKAFFQMKIIKSRYRSRLTD